LGLPCDRGVLDGDLGYGFREFFAHGGGEGGAAVGFAVDEPDVAAAAAGAGEPVEQFAVVGVTGEGVEDFDGGADVVGFAEDIDFAVTAAEFPAEGMFGAVADEEDGGGGVGDVVLEVVEDAAGFAHARGGDDDEGAFEAIEPFGIPGLADHGEAIEAEGVAFLEEFFVDVGVEAFRVEAEDFGGADGEGAVDVDGHVRNAVFAEEFVQHDEELLGAFDREGRDDDLPVFLEGLVEDAAEGLAGIGIWFVFAAAVGAFHDDGVDVFRVFRVAQDVIGAAADVAREEEAAFEAGGEFVEVENDLGGAEDVAGVDESDGDSVGDHHGAVVIEGDELPEAFFGVDFCVERVEGWEALAFAFPVGVGEVGFLDAGGIREHDLAEVAGGRGGEDIAAVAPAGEVGQVARVVDVGVAEDDGVELGGFEGEVLVDVVGFFAVALVESAVEEDAFAVDFDEVAGSGGGAGGAVEGDVHAGGGCPWVAVTGGMTNVAVKERRCKEVAMPRISGTCGDARGCGMVAG